MNTEQKIENAVKVACDYAQTDGSHHKAWVIDQMLRKLLEEEYEQFVKDFCNGDDGPDTYEWDQGVAP